jgi:hypothetical protein
LLGRLERVRERLAEHASAEDRGLPAGLTEPDPSGDERWEAGQVWAHLAEFPGYWLDQVRMIIAAQAADSRGPIQFGRTKTDPGRLGAIERDRRTDPRGLLTRVARDLDEAVEMVRSLPNEAWTAVGRHPTLGAMPVSDILERFLVAHLEEHADQLDGLRATTSSGAF